MRHDELQRKSGGVFADMSSGLTKTSELHNATLKAALAKGLAGGKPSHTRQESLGSPANPSPAASGRHWFHRVLQYFVGVCLLSACRDRVEVEAPP